MTAGAPARARCSQGCSALGTGCEPGARSLALLVRAQETVTGQSSNLEMGKKKEADTEAFISTAEVRPFPPPLMGTGKLSSLMVQAHLSLAYK